jgi:hypothetical protein
MSAYIGMSDFNKAVSDFEAILSTGRNINFHENAYFIETKHNFFSLYYEKINEVNLMYWFVLSFDMNGEHQFIEFDIRNVCAYAHLPLRKTVVMAKDRLSVVGRLLNRGINEGHDNLIVMIKNAQQTYRCGVLIERESTAIDIDESYIPF